MPLAVWKEYCQTLELDRFGEDTLHPYTVGPPAKVAAFINECAFKKTYTRHVTIGADVRTQVSLQNDGDAGPSTRLIDLTEDAPTNKSGKAKKKTSSTYWH